MIGFFVNTLVLRGDLAGDPGFGALLDRSRETTLGAYTHQDLPFEKLVEELRPDRGHAPLFQVLVALHNAPRETLELPGLTATVAAADSGTAKFDLRLALHESAAGLTGDWLYSRDLFDAPTIARLDRSLEALLAAVAANPGLPLSRLPLLGAAERHQIVREWGAARPVSGPLRCLHRLFAAQAARSPGAVAVTLGAESLTYRELNEQANRLAWRLIALGVRPGDLVGLCLERSLEMVVALLGVLEAGAAYLPLDPAYPKERLAFALEDSQVAVLVTRRDLAAALPETTVRRLELDAGRAEIGRESTASPEVPVTPDFPAYVIYTSGSTGRPKGVVVTHANVSRLFTATGAWFDFGSGDVWTLFHSYSFDFSVWELWGALLHGGRLVVVPWWISRSPEAFHELLREERVTVLNQTPSAFRQLLWAGRSAPDLALRTVIFGGEALELASLAPWFERYGDERPRLVNMYGITETTVHVTGRPLSRRDVEDLRGSVIGRPIPDLSLRVLDRDWTPQPIGVPGEIHVGGAGLALGYLGRPELTAARFVPDPFGGPGARLYRSGDLARTLPDGDLEYLGRIDQQVKIRGFRIELGEIETALAAQPEVREAVVLVRETAGERRLVAFLVMDTEIDPGALRERLAAVLPEHMIPASFAVLPALPLTGNGKVDRKALLALEEEVPPARREIVPPRTELERELAALWRSMLGLRDEIGVDDDFFALGGSSITGALLVNQLQTKLGEIVHVVVIFDAPTVRQMAEYLIESHPEAVRRIWGLGQGAAREDGGRVGEAQVARMRALIRPLPPPAVREPRNPPAVFVLSPPRSGTTLLRVLLGGHPRLFAPPELELLSFNTLPERRAAYAGRDSFWLEGLVRAVMEVRGCDAEEAARITAAWEAGGWTSRRAYRQLQEWLGDRILVDKTPSYALDPAVLRRAEEDFDGTFYVHLLRHPCGMIRSFEEAKLDQIFFRSEHGFARRELAELIWRVSHENVLRFLQGIPARRWTQVRFEELLREPEAVLRGLCDRLGLGFDPRMVHPYEDGSRRMTDGLHTASRMLGDVKFHTYEGIEASVAERWRERDEEGSLGDGTARLAVELGYAIQPGLPPALPGSRERERRPALVPLSFAQERLWFLSRLEPESPFYNVPAAFFLTGGLDVPALARSLAEIERRHEGLRTVFAATPEGPVQTVTPPSAADLPVVDLSGLAELAREGEASRLAGEEARRPFDLTAAPPLRLALLRLEARRHALSITLHHIAADGWSVGIFLAELSALYGAFVAGLPSPLPELPLQPADFALWQRERLQGAALAAQLAWWRERLAGAPALLELPTDRPRPAVQRFRGGEVRAALPRDLAGSLAALGRRHAATPFMTLLAGFQALLARWSGQDDVTVGSPVAGRLWPETEPLIGFFVNTLVLRARLDGGSTGEELLARVQRATVEAFAHQEIPFEKIVEELQPARSLAHAPLFQVLLSFQNAPRRAVALPGVEIAAMDLAGGGTAKFDLSLALAERDGSLAGGIEYDADLFDAATVARLLGGFEVLLRALTEDPARRLSDLPLLTPAERQQLAEHNDTGGIDPAAGLCLHQLCERSADLAPDAEALLCGTERLTRGALDRRANRLARHLRRLGVGPEMRVGVALERSMDLVVALLAVLKAGGAYVPLDPAYPRERLALILEDAQRGLDAPLLLTQESLLGRLPETSGRRLCLDRDRDRIDRESDARPEPLAGPSNLAYLIYTSGSTGRPKGVAIEHASAAALLAWAAEAFTPDELDGVLASTSVTFDLSVFELFLPLACGGRVILATDALALPDLPAAGEVRLINSVPSAVAELVRLGAVPPSVRTVNLAGEPLRRALADSLYALPHVERVCNLYGPSEDTTYSTWTLVPAGTAAEPAIGRPIHGTRAYVVDPAMGPQPAGVPGELCLAGAGLARGYLHRPDLTAERFVPDPFGGAGERLYRTGDRVRWRPDGLEFLGRLDHQVKVRGFRVELGEVETALLARPAVREAVVLASGEGGDKRLVAYLETSASERPEDLRAGLAAILPDYMVPAAFVVLDALPRTPNGKVDRQALARVEPERAEAARRGAPRSPVEELLAGVWAEVLRSGPVESGDDFFALGGHSLLAARVVARVREVFGVELPLRSLFETPTLAGLAAHVERARRAERGDAPPPLVRAGRSGPLPASFAQERLWFLDRFGVTGPAYHLTNAVRLRGALEAGALAAALSALVRRHEALRTTFGVVEERVVQVIAPPGPLPLPVLDLRLLSAARREGELRRLAGEEARRLFDLARGPVVRATLVALGEEEHALFLALHHIASDGWSMQVLVRELAVLYAAACAGEPPPFAPLPIQYADFASWQRGWLQGEVLAAHSAWWRRQMAGAPALLALPLDQPRPAVQSFRGARRRAVLPPRLAGELERLGRRHAVSPFMTLLAAFQTLLARVSGGTDVPVGSPAANRDRIETEGVVGFFVNTLVLRTDLSGDPPFGELLRRVRDVVLDAHAHQDLPFEKLVEELRPERDLSHAPLFQVMLLLHAAGEPEARFPGLVVEPLEMDSGTAKFDLLLAVAPERDGGLLGVIEYNRDLFDAPTIERLLASFATLLEGAAADPSRPIAELPLLAPEAEQQIVREWNDTAGASPRRCLHQPFEEWAARAPGALAVVTAGERLTYGELDRQANRLAWHLRGLGVGPGSLVAVYLDRGAGMIAAVLAVHKAGGAYVPVETAWPAERIHGILAGQRIAHVVTSAARRGEIGDLPPLPRLDHVICLEGDLADLPETAPPAMAGPDDLAYVIFTSGSTGRPKGVMVQHGPALNLIDWVNRRFGVGPGDLLLLIANLSFDLSVYDVFGTLAAGAAVRVASAVEQRDPQALARLLCREPVTFWDSAPAALQALVPYFPPPGSLPEPPALRLVFLSGDWIPVPLPDRVRHSFPNSRVVALGGATEATIWSNVYPVGAVDPAWASIPYGRPIRNARYHVLEAAFSPCPVGVEGDLWIGGSCLSSGYAGEPAMTAEKYLPDPFAGEPGSRLYRTGDRARAGPNGTLEFLGRLDTQVKVRGFRIELGEIEAVLAAHPGVREAVVLAREDRPGDQRLVAYVIPALDPPPAAAELRRFAQRKLPEY
ncbi:MAG TPA: amino acid adenylation domain-containing protein, partial [Thermoanaerobaculia bacterium]|nr:amino acid adenylation domain-containing protein [Thermoanaerobaculia bacterium]